VMNQAAWDLDWDGQLPVPVGGQLER